MKRAIILGGGGNKCSFQAGILKCFMGDLNRQYSIYCGILVGAINSVFLSQYYAHATNFAI